MAGTDDALRRRLDDRKLRLMAGSSFRSGPASSKISRSTRPEYRNLVPHEKKLPPVTTDGASELDGNLQVNAVCCCTSYQQYSMQYVAVLHTSNIQCSVLLYFIPAHSISSSCVHKLQHCQLESLIYMHVPTVLRCFCHKIL